MKGLRASHPFTHVLWREFQSGPCTDDPWNQIPAASQAQYPSPLSITKG